MADGGSNRGTESHSFALQFAKSLAAILVGNLIYLLLMPHLPAVMRHRLYTVDFGLLIDFGLCVLVWGVLTLLSERRVHRDD